MTLILSKLDAGIEPFKRAAVRRGEADWVIDRMAIPLPGLWQVHVDILVSDFEKVTLSGEISIEP